MSTSGAGDSDGNSWTIPVSVILSWPTPNYVDPPTLGWAWVVIVAVLAGLSVVVFCARIWVRMVKLKNAGPDDWIMLVALIQFAGEMFYLWAAGLIKISILLFVLRLVNTPVTKIYKYITWGCIAFVAASVFVFTCTLFFGCKPFDAFWYQTDPDWLIAHENQWQCIDEGVTTITTNIFSIIQDFIAVILPVCLFWKLNVSKQRKASILGFFAVGLLVCATGVVRVHYLWESFYGNYDATWNGALSFIWSIAELHLAIICASAPALKALFTKSTDSAPSHTHSTGVTSVTSDSSTNYNHNSKKDSTISSSSWKSDDDGDLELGTMHEGTTAYSVLPNETFSEKNNAAPLGEFGDMVSQSPTGYQQKVLNTVLAARRRSRDVGELY